MSMTTLVLRYGPDSGTEHGWDGPTPLHILGPDASTPPAPDDDVYVRNDTDSTDEVVYTTTLADSGMWGTSCLRTSSGCPHLPARDSLAQRPGLLSSRRG